MISLATIKSSAISLIAKLGGKLGEKINKILLIVTCVLGIACYVLARTTIHFYKTRTSNTTELVTGTVDQQSELILEQQDTIKQLTADLQSARESLESANDRADELEQRNQSAREYVDESAERIDELRDSIQSNARTVSELIGQQQRIIEATSRIITDYRVLKERLGSDTGSNE